MASSLCLYQFTRSLIARKRTILLQHPAQFSNTGRVRGREKRAKKKTKYINSREVEKMTSRSECQSLSTHFSTCVTPLRDDHVRRVSVPCDPDFANGRRRSRSLYATDCVKMDRSVVRFKSFFWVNPESFQTRNTSRPSTLQVLGADCLRET